MNNKSKLKIMVTSLALSAASSGAWGALKPELDAASGCYIWRAIKSETSPGAFFPGEAPYITGKTPVFSCEDSPIFLLRFDPSLRTDENDSNVRKGRGLYNPSKLSGIFSSDLIRGKTVVMHVVMQPIPADFSDGLYLRPDLTCLPSGNPADESTNWKPTKPVKKALSFGVTKIMINGETQQGTVKAVLSKKNNLEITFPGYSLSNPTNFDISVFKLDGLPAIQSNTRHYSFWTYVAFDDLVFITYHWLINREDAKKLKQIARLAFFVKQYEASAYGSWSKVYGTDMLWRSNYEAVCKSLDVPLVADTTTDQQKEAAFRAIIKNVTIQGFINELGTQGHTGILRFMWRLKDNLSYGNDKGNLFFKHSHEPGFAFLYAN